MRLPNKVARHVRLVRLGPTPRSDSELRAFVNRADTSLKPLYGYHETAKIPSWRSIPVHRPLLHSHALCWPYASLQYDDFKALKPELGSNLPKAL